MAFELASTFAAQLSLGQPLTKAVADAVEAIAKKALPSLDTADLRSASNQLRMAEVVRFTKEGKDKDKDKEAESSEQLADLYGSARFKVLQQALEAVITVPLDVVALATGSRSNKGCKWIFNRTTYHL